MSFCEIIESYENLTTDIILFKNIKASNIS